MDILLSLIGLSHHTSQPIFPPVPAPPHQASPRLMGHKPISGSIQLSLDREAKRNPRLLTPSLWALCCLSCSPSWNQGKRPA